MEGDQVEDLLQAGVVVTGFRKIGASRYLNEMEGLKM